MTVGRHPQPLHIALVTHHYSPESGAPQRRWGALMPRFVAEGHRVTVLCPPPHYPSGRAGGRPEGHRVAVVAGDPERKARLAQIDGIVGPRTRDAIAARGGIPVNSGATDAQIRAAGAAWQNMVLGWGYPLD